MRKQHKRDQERSQSEEWTQKSQPKRPYKKVTDKKLSKLFTLAIQGHMNVNRACQRARIPNSNAKVLVRKRKKQLKQEKSKIEDDTILQDVIEINKVQEPQINSQCLNVQSNTSLDAPQQAGQVPVYIIYYLQNFGTQWFYTQ